MLHMIKTVLKKILPAPIINLIKKSRDRRNNEKEILKNLSLLSEKIELLEKKVDSIEDKYIDIKLNSLTLLKESRAEYSSVREILWAQIYNNAVSSSQWLKRNDFAPGRWAVGYPLLYVLFSVLEKTAPRKILELGLGQSTRMITQYALVHPDVEHCVVEQSSEFVEFFSLDNELAPNTRIQLMPYAEGNYKQDTGVRVFDGFQEAFSGQRFDLILIDAPSYNSTSHFSRVDILSILPACLQESFVILLDDCNRSAEMNTANEISLILKESGLHFCEGKYAGEKEFRLWCSENWRFLCSL